MRQHCVYAYTESVGNLLVEMSERDVTQYLDLTVRQAGQRLLDCNRTHTVNTTAQLLYHIAFALYCRKHAGTCADDYCALTPGYEEISHGTPHVGINHIYGGTGVGIVNFRGNRRYGSDYIGLQFKIMVDNPTQSYRTSRIGCNYHYPHCPESAAPPQDLSR